MWINRLITLIMIIASCTFASFYGGPIPYGLLYFSLSIPIVSIIYIFYVYSHFKIYQNVESKILVKGEPAPYSFILSNENKLTFQSIELRFFQDKSTILEHDQIDPYCLLPGDKQSFSSMLICNYRDELYYAFFIMLGVSLLSSICIYPLQKFKYTQLVLMVYLFIGLICCSIYGIELTKGVVFLALAYNACILTQMGYEFQHSLRSLFKENASVFLLPFSLLIALSIFFFPTPQTPINWSIVIDFIDDVSENISGLFYDLQLKLSNETNEFGMNINGFNSSDATTLGGKLTQNNSVLISIDARSRYKNPIYLKGSIYNAYTGTGWKKDKLPSIEGYNEFELDCHENLHTQTLFWPNSTHQIIQRKDPKKINTQGSNILFSRAPKSGLHYQLSFMENNPPYIILTIAFILILLLVLFTLYITYVTWNYRRDLKKGMPNQKAKLLLIEILFCLEKRGYKKKQTQSLLDYAQCVSFKFLITKEGKTTFIVALPSLVVIYFYPFQLPMYLLFFIFLKCFSFSKMPFS